MKNSIQFAFIPRESMVTLPLVPHKLVLLNRRLFITTVIELILIARPAIEGLISKFRDGINAPAATGISITL